MVHPSCGYFFNSHKEYKVYDQNCKKGYNSINIKKNMQLKQVQTFWKWCETVHLSKTIAQIAWVVKEYDLLEFIIFNFSIFYYRVIIKYSSVYVFMKHTMYLTYFTQELINNFRYYAHNESTRIYLLQLDKFWLLTSVMCIHFERLSSSANIRYRRTVDAESSSQIVWNAWQNLILN